MPKIAATVSAVPASGIRRIFELAADLEDVIQLSVGEPELPVAPHILEAGARAWQADVTNYTPNRWDPLESTCRHASLSIL